MLRKGMLARTYDLGALTAVFCDGGFFGNGSHCWPRLTVILRDRWTRSNGRGGRATIYRRLSLPMPYVRWARSPRLNRVFVRLYYRAFYMGKRA